VLFVAAIFVAACWLGLHRHLALAADAEDEKKPATTAPAPEGGGGEEEPKAIAPVTTVPIRAGDISQTITAYGSVTAQPGEIAVFSVQFECRVKHVAVVAGQPIDKGTALIEVEPSPEAKLLLLEARNAVESSKKDLESTQQRVNMKLATGQDLLTAQQAAQVAQMRLKSLEDRGAAEDSRTLTSDNAGVVSKIDVQESQIVAAGSPMVESVARSSIVARIGVDPNDVAMLKVDQPVRLFVAGATPPPTTAPATTEPSDEDAGALPGKIRLITQRINPDTRMVDVFAAPDSDPILLLDAALRAELTTQSRPQALIVPREAVLPDEDGLLLFTVKDGKAVKHVVKTGLHNDKEVEVISDDLKPGDPAVILGNLELEDGMSVKTEGAASEK
jgi:RND family efflux transporter MFP subunit